MSHRPLLDALLDEHPDLGHAYLTDAEFHHALDVILRTLPAFLRLMADDCGQRAADRRAMQYAARMSSPITLTPEAEAALRELLDRDPPTPPRREP